MPTLADCARLHHMPDLTGLRQPDQRSCGAAVLVAAQLLVQPSYAALLTTPSQWRDEVLAMHRRVTSAYDAAGRLQVPWPRALGTPPWAAAHQLEAITGVAHDVDLVVDRGTAFDRLLETTGPAPLYVGSWLPRHVVLVTGASSGTLRCYDPAQGAIGTFTRGAFVGARLRLSGWDRAWFTILPRPGP